MTDQTLMEMLVEGFDDETKNKYKDKDGMYLDLSEWPCVTLDDDERVTKIDMSNANVSGSLELCYIPPKVERLYLGSNRLTGEIDLTRLPDIMCGLYLQNNRLTGEINVTQLPGGMTHLYMNNNQLSGSLILKNLPQRLNAIDARGNHFDAIGVVESKIHARIKLEESGVTSVVDENGNEQDMQLFLK